MTTRGLAFRVIAMIVSSALLAGCSGHGARALPSFALTNQSGLVIRSEHLGGRVVLVSFLFTSCHDTCPLVTARLARAQTELRAAGLAERVRFVSITLDPGTDTPDVLRRYAERYGADRANWDFLTGPAEEIGRVLREIGGVVEGEGKPAGHMDLVLLVNPRGEVVRRFSGAALGPDRVRDEVRRLAGPSTSAQRRAMSSMTRTSSAERSKS